MRQLRIDRLNEDVEELDKDLLSIMESNPDYKRLYAVYIRMTGIGNLGACTWVLEGQDLNRFAHPTNLMSYLGLVPRKKSSAGKDPALCITKAGNPYLRYVTVCAARCYTDRRLTQGKTDLEKYPEPLRSLLARCQDRLCNRYQYLRREKKKNGNKAKVAIAREMCAFIWEAIAVVLPQLETHQWAMAA